MTAKMIFVNS